MAKNTVVLTASGQATTGVGIISKIIVGTHSSGVIRLIDSPSGASGRVILGSYTLPAGAQILDLNLEFYEGVYFELVSGTASIQLVTS